jgi:2-dehydro-3-deoxy-D-arabinonate dehydratase
MTRIIRFADESGTVRTGVADGSGSVRAFEGATRIADLLRLPVDELRTLLERTAGAAAAFAESDVLVLPPLDGHMELWAAGVTYERSREARIAESTEQSVYERVYDAERPELFFKAPPWRVVTDGEPVAVRDDSPLNVPEPELGLVVNSRGETAGYVVTDDVSSRTIEGENPLYLPQAKIYGGSGAVSSGIVPAWEVEDVHALRISLTVTRDGATAFEGETSTSAFHRDPLGLPAYLYHAQPFPDGAVLATGTGIVPGMDFTLQDGDTATIEIEGVGVLSNPVVGDQAKLDWLVDAVDDPMVRRAHRAA